MSLTLCVTNLLLRPKKKLCGEHQMVGYTIKYMEMCALNEHWNDFIKAEI